ncbi:ankyrin repeat domain-containing protein [Luteolibacter sp. AS25]|uniref:ankyrin repeat domain-containing protein n=1 Tax=Luteolibacter sp. AS25 TaxID=3135776 RepID=UPI00398B008B
MINDSLTLWLYEAIRANSYMEVASLIEQGVDTNERIGSNMTPLMVACALGLPGIVEQLLDAGADLHTVDSSLGASPLHKAAQSGCVDVAELLLNRGAFINLQSAATGHTPLIDAVWAKRTGMVKFLLSRGASVNIVGHHQQTVFDFLGTEPVWTAGFTTPSDEAWGRDILQLCLDKKAQDEQIIASQKLMAAVGAGDLDEVKKLIAAGVDVNEKTPVVGSGNDGQTPLLVACFMGYADIVRELITAGAKETINDYLMAATPAHKACYAGQPEALKVLLEMSPTVDLTAQGPYNGYTALHDSCWHGHIECVKALLEYGVPLDQENHQGETPAQFARSHGYNDIAELIETAVAQSDTAQAQID